MQIRMLSLVTAFRGWQLVVASHSGTFREMVLRIWIFVAYSLAVRTVCAYRCSIVFGGLVVLEDTYVLSLSQYGKPRKRDIAGMQKENVKGGVQLPN